MSVLTIVILLFLCLGAIDYLIGNKFGLGAEFERGFKLLGTMALSMIGMIVIAPWIASTISPVFDWIYEILHIDPSIIPASLFANDMGGAPLAIEVTKNPEVGRFNALVVSSMMGATMSFTIPIALQMVAQKQHNMLAYGLLCGIATIPAGCIFAGFICGISIGVLMVDILPLLILAVVIGTGLILIPDFCVKAFKVLGFIMKLLIMLGLIIGVVNFLAKEELLRGMGTLEDGVMICINASVVMSGMFPLLYLVTKLMKKPLKRLGKITKMNDAGMMGMVSSLATNITAFGNMSSMDSKGVMLNSAFAVSGAFTFAAHLAFTMAFDANYLLPVIAGKLFAGLLAVVLANLVFKRVQEK